MSTKYYLFATIIFLVFFLFIWLPRADVELIVQSEEWSKEFKVSLDSQAEKIFFNLDVLPAKIISKEEKDKLAGYIFLDELTSKEGDKFIIFKKDDLEKLLESKAKPLLPKDKAFFDFEADNWQIKVQEKDPNLLWANMEVKVKGRIIPEYNLEEMRREVIFKDMTTACDALGAILSLKDCKIFIWPKFFKYLPIFKERIKLLLKTG
ncbi:hypothetical protein GW896_02060 [Candidatus Kuenenbacteria bacterium]|nr:hypothetical protein [Candidatus Kuenenbacteria bacterium]